MEIARTEVDVFRLIWNAKGMAKVTTLVWQLLLDKTPTRYNLQRRVVNLPVQSRGCVLCDSGGNYGASLFALPLRGKSACGKEIEKLAVGLGHGAVLFMTSS
ncbi:hypothetical protein A2U01_0000321 [Trifolium medium]|uniref:Reverse transcriptase zinc-binding domain-containing protein n=1 Tax=Trifolium medium TaxID=97028 RepID=A0A392LX92_9FABA|nr:hypothetical protein [Trifolium medium]